MSLDVNPVMLLPLLLLLSISSHTLSFSLSPP